MPDLHAIEAALSFERFGRYMDWAAGDRAGALRLYSLNAQLSEALSIPIHALEIALRNRIHGTMSARHGDRWFEGEQMLQTANQREQLAAAVAELERNGKAQEAGRIVAGLPFSFWTAMFGTAYEQLWRIELNKIALSQDGKRLTRKYFSGPLTRIRLLRNRIAHHEPIQGWNLPKHHATMMGMTELMSLPVAEWARSIDRFAAVYGSGYVLQLVSKASS